MKNKDKERQWHADPLKKYYRFEYNRYSGSPEKQNPYIEMVMERDLLWELAHIIMEPEKFQDMLSISWSPGRDDGVNSSVSPRKPTV